ncbi:hypothetical protein, partial [Shewanella sairae]|uniref:hypothetical protein n=1 Tax=Shewanella sairae TaxID=190310 RepID=UPI001C7EB116
LCNWLDKFISKHVTLMLDIESEETRFSDYTEIVGEKIVTEILEDEEGNIIFNIYITPKVEVLLDTSGQAESFFQHYIYDRFFNSMFKRVPSKDIVKVSRNDQIIVIELPSEHISNIVKDTF